ncbi:conserved hypothetical protein [Pseudomonas sp. OF001]|uniref:hypothetical protein n=1 Tax=Pseudomonas sp. OF001 TaxID=2772300 RepID=UPI00191AE00B|nr:hypothetical protein [Pseudomonas sp. OF001]CAD5377440.1 conserved hypothetical protein [Pseudomonas sp. OF001]
MDGLFDDLEQAAPQQAPAGGLFDDLEAEVANPQRVAGSPHAGINAALPDGLRQLADKADDFGVSLSKGMVGAAESVVGLGNIASGGALGNWLQAQFGFDPAKRRAKLEAEATPEYQQAQQAVRQAQGFGDTLRQIVRNPSTIPHAVVESLPSMALGGVVGRGVGAGAQLLGRSAGVLAPAIGEGVVSAGQAAENIRQQTGDLSAGGAAAAVGTGALTGLLGAAGAAAGRALGVADVDALLSGQNGASVASGLVNRVLKGAGLESLEEMSQSSQEQVLQNLATGKPLMQGVGQSAALGGVVGAATGGAAGVRQPRVGELIDQRATEAAKMSGPFAEVHRQVKANEAALQGAQPGAQGPQAPGATVPPAPATPAQPVPFAGSADIAPLLDRLRVEGDQRQQTLDLLTPAEQEIQARRRGTVSLEEQRRLANMIGLDGAEQLAFTRKLGQTWNAEETHAAIDLVHKEIESVMLRQEAIISGRAGDADKAAFVDHVRQLQTLFGELAGARAESGRALAAYRSRMNTMANAQAVLDQIGGAQSAEALALALQKAQQAGGWANVGKVLRKGEGFWQKLFGDYLRAAWLSRPSTHVVNMVGNTAVLANEIIERSIAAGIAAGKRAVGARGQTVFAEPLAMLIGALKAQKPAIEAAGKAFITGESPLLGGSAKREAGHTLRNLQDLTAFDPRYQDKAAVAGRIADTAALLPFRFLTAADAFFAAANYGAELRALAARQARAEKAAGTLPQGTRLSARVEELAANPTPEMIEQAGDASRVRTFNSKAGPIAQAVMIAKQGAPWLNVVAPFVRTPSLIIKYALARTPVAPVLSDVREDFKAGGARAESAAARIAWGTTVMAAAGMLAQAGYLTGAGPENEREKKALMATGWRPYSVKLPDGSHVSYSRADPFASLIGFGADLATGKLGREGTTATDAVGEVLASAANNITSKTWLTGIADLLGFLENPRQNAQWYVSKTLGSLVQPYAILAGAAGADDGVMRQPSGVLEGIANRTPGLRDDLLPRLDGWGREVPNPSTGLGALFNPAPASQPTDDPVVAEASALGWAPPTLGKSLTVRGQKIDLTPEQHHEYRRLAGRLMHLAARKAMAQRGWHRLGAEQRVDALNALQRKAQQAARMAVLPWLTTGNRTALDKLHARIDQQEGNTR